MSDRLADGIPQLAHAAARLPGWTPDTFWRATPAELALGLGTSGNPPDTMTRAELARLMEQGDER